MTDTSATPVSDLIDRTAVDVNGDKIGTIFDVYLDNETNQPEWLAVNTGLFASKVSFVPIAGASMVGDDVKVAYTKEVVKDAPNAEADGELSPQEEDALYAHYGRQGRTAAPHHSSLAGTPEQDSDESDSAATMTRSEEELNVEKTTRQTGVARLRKWVETENVTMTVPIRREKARLVVEPVTDSDREADISSDDLSSEEQEIVLSEEVIDIQKTVVPKERVRLETDVETDEIIVDEEIRKERIALEDESS